jgi:methylated-DNA-[protein]-cysteine S-methyltransferase
MIGRIEFDTPLGPMQAVVKDGRLAALDFLPAGRFPDPGESSRTPGGMPMLHRTREQVQEYFRGERKDFELPLALEGTAFQRQVWERLRHIPFGRTIGYGDLAAAVGRPGAARAVGGAVGRNPIPLVVPCHRVIGHDGSLVGFASGLDRKRFLLELEAAAQSGRGGS